MLSVPVVHTEIFGGFAVANGVVCYDGVDLSFEYVIEDAILSAIRSDVREVRVAVEELASISLKKSMFGGKIMIRAHRVMAIAGFPGSSGPSITLKIKRKDREEAEAFVSALSLAIAEARLARLERPDRGAPRRVHGEGEEPIVIRIE